MANDFEFDEFDDLDSSFDSGVEENNSRNPSSALRDGAESFKEHFLDKENVPERLKNSGKALFKGFIGSENAGRIESMNSSFSNEIEKSVTELKKDLRPITTAIEKIAPKDGILGKISNKFLSAISSSEENRNGDISEEDKLNNRVTSALSGLKNFNETSNEELLKEMIKFKQINNQTTLLQSIAGSISSLDKYTRNAANEFYKKSLELQYRQTFLTSDIKTILSLGFDRLAKEQDVIAKNTALPDFVKLKSTEALKQTARNKVSNMFIDRLFERNSFLDNVKANALGRIKSNVDEVKSYVSTANDFLEIGNDLNDGLNDAQEAGISKGNMIGSQAAESTEGLANTFFGKLLAKNKTAQKVTRGLTHAVIGGSDYLDGVAERKKGTFLGSIAAYVRDLGRDPGMNGTTGISEDNLTDNVMFDRRAHLSITKVIPGYLAKILQSLEKFRTGKSVFEKMYDFDQDKFISKNTYKKTLNEDLSKNIYNSGLTYSINSIIDKLLYKNKSIKLDKKEKDELTRILYMYASDDNSMNPEFLEKNGFYKNFKDKNLRGKVKALFNGYIYDKDGKLDLTSVDNLQHNLNSIKTTMYSPRQLLTKHKDNGNTQELVKYGLLEYDNNSGEYKINMQNYHKYASELLVNTTNDDFEKFMSNKENKQNFTTLKDVYKQGKEDLKKVDKDELKKSFSDKKTKIINDLKAFDEKVSKMSKDDFDKLGADTKEKAVKVVEEMYKGNVSEAHRKKIDDYLNKLYKTKTYEYSKDKINKTVDYIKNTDKEKFEKDLKYVRKKLGIRYKRVLTLIKETKKDDLFALGLTTRQKAFDYFSELYGKTDIKSLKRIEDELTKVYDKFDKEEAKEYFTKLKNTSENKIKGEINRAKSRYKDLELYVKSLNDKDFEELGIDNAEDALRYINDNNELSKKELKKIYKILVKVFATKKSKENIKSSFTNAFDKTKSKAKDFKNSTEEKVKDYKEKAEEESKTLFETLSKFFKNKDEKEKDKKEQEKVNKKEELKKKREEKKKKLEEEKEAKRKSFYDSDNDGLRNNGWKEQLSSNKKTNKKEKPTTKEPKKKKIGGVLGLLLSTVSFGFKSLGTLLGTITSSVGAVTSILGGIGSIISAIGSHMGIPIAKGAWWATKQIVKNSYKLATGIPAAVIASKDVVTKAGGLVKSGARLLVTNPKDAFKALLSYGKKGFSLLGKTGPMMLAAGGFYLADYFTDGKVSKGLNDFTKTLIDKVSGFFHDVGDYSSQELKDKLKDDPGKLIIEASHDGLFKLVDDKDFSDIYKKAIREIEVEIIMLNSHLEHTRNRHTKRHDEIKIKSLLKTRDVLITEARSELSNRKKAEKIKEKKDKNYGLIRDNYIKNRQKDLISINNKLVATEKKLKTTKDEAKRNDLIKQIDTLKKDRLNTIKSFSSFVSETNGLTNEEFVKNYVDNRTNDTSTSKTINTANVNEKVSVKTKTVVNSKIKSKNDKPIKIDTSYRSFLKPPFDVAGYIIRKVESNNNYGVSGIVKGEHFVSFGAYQFSEKSGSLKKALIMLAGSGTSYSDEVKEHLKLFKGVWYKGDRAKLSAFLSRIGVDKKAKEIQDKLFYSMYCRPAYNEYKNLKIDNPLLLVHMIDHYHNRGNVKTFIRLYKSSHNIIESRLADYRHLNNWYKYGKGWTSRVHTTDKLARKLIGDKNIPEDTSTPETNVSSDETNNTQKNESGVGTILKAALNNILEFFGVKELSDSLRSNEDLNRSDNKKLDINEDNSEMKKNNATKLNPIINDWATEMRYNSLNDEAKTFFSKFSHYALSHGIRLMIPKYGGNRSVENQKKLYSIGRNGKGGKPVTKTLKSKHRGGRAIDIISSKGFKAVKENHQIALMMRSFANDNPELGAGFLDIKWDPNHVQFTKSKPIKEIDVEKEILQGKGKINDKEIVKKYEEASMNNPVKSTRSKFVTSPKVNKLNINNHMSTDINSKSILTDVPIDIKNIKNNITTEVKDIKIPTVKRSPIIKKSVELIPEIKHQIESIKTHIPNTVQHNVDIYDQYAEKKYKTLTSIDQTLKNILEINTDILSTLGNKKTDVKKIEKKKTIPEPIINVRR